MLSTDYQSVTITIFIGSFKKSQSNFFFLQTLCLLLSLVTDSLEVVGKQQNLVSWQQSFSIFYDEQELKYNTNIHPGNLSLGNQNQT